MDNMLERISKSKKKLSASRSLAQVAKKKYVCQWFASEASNPKPNERVKKLSSLQKIRMSHHLTASTMWLLSVESITTAVPPK